MIRIHAKLIKASLIAGLSAALLIFILDYKNILAQNTDLVNLDTSQATHISELPSIVYQETIYDFGTILADEVITHEFLFTNQGYKPLVIYEVVPSCNLCTTVSWPQEPILPNQTGAIKVTFNSTGRSGKQGKYLIVRANTEPTETRLLIRGEINPAY